MAQNRYRSTCKHVSSILGELQTKMKEQIKKAQPYFELKFQLRQAIYFSYLIVIYEEELKILMLYIIKFCFMVSNVKLINHDCMLIFMLLYIMLYIMFAYLMLFAVLSNDVCLYNGFFCH